MVPPRTWTGYWSYYHPNFPTETGFSDLLMCGQWTETDHPAYPKDRK